jgi:hypothetical protein
MKATWRTVLLRISGAAVFGAGAFAAAGVAAQSSASTLAPDCTTWPCGHIESIVQTTTTENWTPLGAGTYGSTGMGGTPAAVTNYQWGPGMKPQGMVLLGAAGGAAYQKSPNSYQKPRWNVTVKLDGGQKRVVSLSFEPFVREGDYVRVVGNNVELVD